MQKLNRFGYLGAVVATLALLTSGCGKQSATAGAPPPSGPPEVSVVEVQPQTVSLTTELPGRTSAYLVAEVRPQVNGIIQKRLFTEGADVRAGEVLYQIDAAPYQAAYASAKAAVGKAEANLIPLKLKADRYRQLVATNAVSKQDYDDAAAAVKTAEAEVEAAKANLQTASINLNYTKVTAPIAGRIGRSSVTTGSLVTASQATALATIQKLDPVYVDVTQSTSDLLRMRQAVAAGRLQKGGAGQAKVKLLLEDGSRYPLDGALKFSDVTVDQGTGSVILRTVFPNPKNQLLPGMYVRAQVEEGVVSNAILLPQQAVSRDQMGNAVALVVGADSKVAPRPLKVSRAVGDKWLVDDGLKPGDKVIVEGQQKGRPGTTVKAVPFVPKSAAAMGALGQPGAAPQGAAQPAAQAKK
ncbi:efflux RND transporter periplasmic adaptor subunit [Geomonas sp. Red32]|uniref:efflux RND transporter periplasmic adaptor subunit n=1 Tax=Geomonas sp. Red32 TaxID=2912856 RepID=UPI00202CF717|nr:efflux RND transporter periplasmic adaptor subunit [Geomonas sp. Red32]MCM0082915.1 efflux RND transporter periplasmic adaptor subunit [Geomonas sp. Red32]